MVKLKSICLFFSLALTAILAPGQSRPSGIVSLALMHVTVIDGTGAPPRADMTVLITGYRIAEIAKSNTISVPRFARTIDATGSFVIPGLWDMHAHPDDPELWPVNPPPQEKEKLLTRVKDIAGDGRHELFKSTKQFDGPHHRKQHAFDLETA